MTIEIGFLIVGLWIGTFIGLFFGYVVSKDKLKHPIMFNEQKYRKIERDYNRQVALLLKLKKEEERNGSSW